MPNFDLEYLVLNYRRLSPAGHSRLRSLIVARAKEMRLEHLRELWARFLAWQLARTAVAQLQGLDDAALKDIGLHRSGIEAAVARGEAPKAAEQRRAFPDKRHLLLQKAG